MAAFTSIAAGIGAATGLIGGAVGAAKGKKDARRARDAQEAQARELKSLKNSRATIINPYEGTKDLSGMAKDLSGQMSNPFSNLGVATQAAEIKIEQADIALANTLDTLRATGASAGGATALAQAALQSKKGVAASIEGQEATNEKMRAQGEEALQSQKMREQQRVQGVQIDEGRRTQTADARGKSFQFNAQERREDGKIDFTRQQIGGAQKREQQAYDQGTRAMTGAITGAFGAVGDIASAGGFYKGPGGSGSAAYAQDRKAGLII